MPATATPSRFDGLAVPTGDRLTPPAARRWACPRLDSARRYSGAMERAEPAVLIGSRLPSPLGAGSLAANVVAHGATLIAVLARDAGKGAAAAQAGRIRARAGVLATTNDIAFAAAMRHLDAAARGDGDGIWLALALGDAAGVALVIAETSADLALLAADLASLVDGSRRVDCIGISRLAAAAASCAALLVSVNLVVGEGDGRLAAAVEAANQAARAAAIDSL